jgi:hypothetical protein
MHPERSELALASFLQDLPDFGGANSERGYRDLQDLPDLLTTEQALFLNISARRRRQRHESMQVATVRLAH